MPHQSHLEHTWNTFYHLENHPEKDRKKYPKRSKNCDVFKLTKLSQFLLRLVLDKICNSTFNGTIRIKLTESSNTDCKPQTD